MEKLLLVYRRCTGPRAARHHTHPREEADSKRVLGQLWQICLGLWTEVSEPSAEMVEAVGLAVRAGSEEPWKLNGVTV